MNILYVLPYDTAYRHKTAFLPALSYQPLTLSTLAALTPEALGASITLVDEGVMRFDYSRQHYDVVGISVCTSSAPRGYELAEYFKARGSHVLIGGHHASLLAQEAGAHADAVFVGSAENTLPAFFRDYLAGTTKPLYEAANIDVAAMPTPRRDLMPRKGYLKQPTVIASYGCSNSCRYCVIHSFWGSSANRPVAAVVAELQGLKAQGASEFLFLDPSPLSNKAYARELFEAMAPLGIKWAGLATLDAADDDDLLCAMAKSGCIGTLLGFETFNAADLLSMGKYKNKVESYAGVVAKLHGHGIAVLGTFMLGFGGDTLDSLGELAGLVEQARIDVPRFAIATPYPNTPFFNKLEADGRILHRDWSKYDGIHCVFQPKNMRAGQLEQAHLRVWDDTYSIARILARLRHTPQRKATALITNLGFRIYARRLKALI